MTRLTQHTVVFFLVLGCSASVAAAQSWSLSAMIEDDLLPTIMDASYDLSEFRGELLGTQNGDSVWVSTYGPEGPNGQPFQARVAHSESEGAWSYWITITVTPENQQNLFNVAAGAFATVLDAQFDGLGWARTMMGQQGQPRQVLAWQECGSGGDISGGRVAMVHRRPSADGSEAELKFQFLHQFEETCDE